MAVITTGLIDSEMILDWLSFTLPAEDGEEVKSQLEMVQLFGEMVPRPVGIKGYSHSATIVGTGVVGWSPDRPEQGVHVQLPSGALGNLLEAYPPVRDISGFLSFLVSNAEAKIRRIDLAFDDREGQLSMGTIGECIDKRLLVTRWRKVDQLRQLIGGEGQTFYFGSRVSESYLRIYDKQAEQIEKGEEDPGHWIRVELEFKKDKAHAVTERYLADGVPFVAGLLRGLIEFKEPCGDPNKSRWPVALWWDEFIRNAEKATICLPQEAPTIDRTKEWLERQVAPSLAFVTEAEAGSVDFIYDLLKSGRTRITSYQRALLQVAERAAGVRV